MSVGPRATSAFVVLTGLLFAAVLVLLGWRANASGLGAWLLAAALVVGIIVVVLAVFFARGVGEGRL